MFDMTKFLIYLLVAATQISSCTGVQAMAGRNISTHSGLSYVSRISALKKECSVIARIALQNSQSDSCFANDCLTLLPRCRTKSLHGCLDNTCVCWSLVLCE